MAGNPKPKPSPKPSPKPTGNKPASGGPNKPKPSPKPTPGVSVPWTIEELNQESPPPEGMEWQLQPHGGAILVPSPTPLPPPPPPPTPRPPSSAGPPVSYSPPPPPPPPVPNNTWDTNITYVSPTGIKQASPDIIVFDEEIDPDFIVESFFEEFGGTELIKISRSDLIFSSKTDLINIKNIEDIQQRFSSKNLIPIKSVQDNFARYGIDLFKRNVFAPYFDDGGNLVIEIGTIRSNEVVDVEVLRDGTIDEVDES